MSLGIPNVLPDLIVVKCYYCIRNHHPNENDGRRVLVLK